MRWIGVVAAVGAVGAFGVGASASGAAGAAAKTCVGAFTEARTASKLTVRGDTCARARKVSERAVAVAPRGCVKVLDRKGRIGFRRPCVQLSYTCNAVSANRHRALKVTCTRGSRKITFNY